MGKGGIASKREEPVEVYVKRMKATMMERMEGLHKAQQRKIELGYEEQLEWRREAVGKQDAELAAAEEELREATKAESASREECFAEIGALQAELDEAKRSLDELKAQPAALAWLPAQVPPGVHIVLACADPPKELLRRHPAAAR